jgi:hypothetical protein
MTEAEPKLETIARTRSEYTQALLHLDGKPVNLSQYPMYIAIYDGDYKKTVLKTCRQVGKSTTLSNFTITNSIARPFFKTLFISPTKEQTLTFSTSRVGKTIEYSPKIKDHYIDPSRPNRVLLREFKNGSEIKFTYALDDADRVRGNSADDLMLDEVQDILLDDVLAVAKECISNSNWQYEHYCGTPKTFENGLESVWQMSSQTEWGMKCEGCGQYNVVCTEKSVGKHGPICLKCGTCLNPRLGQWIDMKSGKDAVYKGFHISRPIMPRNVPAAWTNAADKEKAQELWNEVLGKMEGPGAYSTSKFRNEVLGVSDSVGQRVVTMEMLREACDGPMISDRQTPAIMQGVSPAIAAGVDWSGGGSEKTSFTVLWILGKMMNSVRQRTLYFKIFPGSHPIQEARDIAATIGMFKVQVVVCDAGEGNANTDELRRAMSHSHVPIHKVRYGSSPQYISWNEKPAVFNVNRTAAIDSTMFALARKEIQFPRSTDQNLMLAAFDQILNEYVETTAMEYKVWRHAPTKPDDSLHAITFARIGIQIATGQLDLRG